MTGMHRVPAGTKPPVPGDRGALPLLRGSEKPLDWGGTDAPQQPPPHPTPTSTFQTKSLFVVRSEQIGKVRGLWGHAIVACVQETFLDKERKSQRVLLRKFEASWGGCGAAAGSQAACPALQGTARVARSWSGGSVLTASLAGGPAELSVSFMQRCR